MRVTSSTSPYSKNTGETKLNSITPDRGVTPPVNVGILSVLKLSKTKKKQLKNKQTNKKREFLWPKEENPTLDVVPDENSTLSDFPEIVPAAFIPSYEISVEEEHSNDSFTHSPHTSQPVPNTPKTTLHSKAARTPKHSGPREVKLNEGEIIIWDELKDCIHPYDKPGHDKEISVTVNPLSPSYEGTIDEWKGQDLDKRVISSPSFNVGSVTVKAEEIGLVLVILFLWAGAISLFINRWGKLRMLEPYQPAYTAPETTSPPRLAPQQTPFININIQSTSSLSLNDGFRRSSTPDWNTPYDAGDYLDPRRDSMMRCSFSGPSPDGMGTTHSVSLGIDGCPGTFMMPPLTPQRRVRSAVDLVSLVMQEKMATSKNPFAATNV